MLNASTGSLEATVTCMGLGGVFGGMVVGSAADLLRLPINTMAAYAAGVVMGAIGGLVAGRIAVALLVPRQD